MSYASWPYNRGEANSIVALRAGLDSFDQDTTEDEGSYQASIASLVRAARDVAAERPLSLFARSASASCSPHKG